MAFGKPLVFPDDHPPWAVDADQNNYCIYFYNLTTAAYEVVAGICGNAGRTGDGSLASRAKFSTELNGLAAAPTSTGLIYVCDGGRRLRVRAGRAVPSGPVR